MRELIPGENINRQNFAGELNCWAEISMGRKLRGGIVSVRENSMFMPNVINWGCRERLRVCANALGHLDMKKTYLGLSMKRLMKPRICTAAQNATEIS